MLYKILYRFLRNNLVTRLRAKGLTWNQINSVLRATGQKVVTQVAYERDGVQIHFANPGPELRKKPIK